VTSRTSKKIASPLASAVRSVVEPLEGRTLFAVNLPFQLDWSPSETRSGLAGNNGAETGFELVNGPAFNASLVNVDSANGDLRLTSTPTTPYDATNSLVNNLVNEFDAGEQFSVTTRIEDLTTALATSGRQAGLWFGPDQDNYVKLVVVSTPKGSRLQFQDERAVGPVSVHTATTAQTFTTLTGTIESVELRLDGTRNATTGVSTVAAYYKVNNAPTFTKLPLEYTFTGEQAEQFFNEESRAGIVAMHRASSSAYAFAFDRFAITSVPGPGGPVLSPSATDAYYNETINDSSTSAQTFTFTNTGTTALTLGGSAVTLSGPNAGLFTIVSNTLPATLAAGQSGQVQVAFRPTGSDNIANRGLKTATLNVASATDTASVNLRALATAVSGEDAEPSLQRVLDLYQIPIVTGDTDPDDAELYDDEEPLAAVTDEVAASRLVKAGAGPVTIETLGAFAVPENVSVRLGYYRSGSPLERTQLGTIKGDDSQSVNATLQGPTSFDPGTGAFSLYGTFPGNSASGTRFMNADGGGTGLAAGGSPRDVFAEDQLNTWDPASPHKIRFYPLKDAGGAVVPNAYVFAMEEYDLEFDSNDYIGIIRNVSIAPAAPEIGVVNPDPAPLANVLTFNNITNRDPADVNAPDNVVHDVVTLKVHNTGSQPLNISTIAATGPFLVSQPGPVTVAPGTSTDVTVTFTGTGLPALQTGVLTIASNDPDEPTKTFDLRGITQDRSEGTNERDLQTIVQAFGFGTVTGTPGQLNTLGQPTPVGDEIISPYWTSADGGEVVVRQLAAFHTQGNQSTIRWFTQAGTGVGQAAAPAPSNLRALNNSASATGNDILVTWTDNSTTETGFQIERSTNGGAYSVVGTVAPNVTTFTHSNQSAGTTHSYRVKAIAGDAGGIDTGYSNTASNGSVLSHVGVDAQSFYPRRANAATGYQPVAYFQPDAPFGFRLDEENSDDSLNTQENDDTTATPHRVRFYPAKTEAGVVIANTYIAVMDFNGINYDFNDNIYLISNIAPANAVAAPTAAAAYTDASGALNLDWADNVEAGVTGYNVYRSTDGATFALLNSAPLTASAFVDSTAVANTAYTYRVTAIGPNGESLPRTVAVNATGGYSTFAVGTLTLAQPATGSLAELTGLTSAVDVFANQ
jgi:hypothetical protein